MELMCEFYFIVDSVAHLDNPQTLRLLIEQNRPVLAPMMVRPNTTYSNFWSALTPNGQFARSMDYTDLVQNSRRYAKCFVIFFFIVNEWNCLTMKMAGAH